MQQEKFGWDWENHFHIYSESYGESLLKNLIDIFIIWCLAGEYLLDSISMDVWMCDVDKSLHSLQIFVFKLWLRRDLNRGQDGNYFIGRFR